MSVRSTIISEGPIHIFEVFGEIGITLNEDKPRLSYWMEEYGFLLTMDELKKIRDELIDYLENK